MAYRGLIFVLLGFVFTPCALQGFQEVDVQALVRRTADSFQTDFKSESIQAVTHNYLVTGQGKPLEYRESDGLLYIKPLSEAPAFFNSKGISWKLGKVQYKPVQILQSPRLGYQGEPLKELKSINNRQNEEDYSTDRYSKEVVYLLRALMNFGPLSRGQQGYYSFKILKEHGDTLSIGYEKNDQVSKSQNPLIARGTIDLVKHKLVRFTGNGIDYNAMEHGNVERFAVSANYEIDFVMNFDPAGTKKDVFLEKRWIRSRGTGRMGPRSFPAENQVIEYEFLKFQQILPITQFELWKERIGSMFEYTPETLEKTRLKSTGGCPEVFPCAGVPDHSSLAASSGQLTGHSYFKSSFTTQQQDELLLSLLRELYLLVK